MTHPPESENRRLREALEGIAAMEGKTLISVGMGQPYSIGASRAFDQCANMARAALAAEPASGEADDYDLKCVNGHDKCHEGPFDGCPYCERVYAAPPPTPPQAAANYQLVGGEWAPPPPPLEVLGDQRIGVPLGPDGVYLTGAEQPASGEATHGSPELDADAAKLVAMGADPGPTFADIFAPPPPPTQGEEDTARAIEICHELGGAFGHSDVLMIAAALRQRADEAMRAEREACAKMVDKYLPTLAAAIRARIAPPT